MYENESKDLHLLSMWLILIMFELIKKVEFNFVFFL